MSAPAPTPTAAPKTFQTVRRLRSGASILEGTIRGALPPSRQRQTALMHVAAALAGAIEAVMANAAEGASDA
jgi:hypothetical protein